MNAIRDLGADVFARFGAHREALALYLDGLYAGDAPQQPFGTCTVRACNFDIQRLARIQASSQLIRFAFGDQLPAIEDNHTVADLFGLAQDMGAEQNGVIVRQSAHVLAHLDHLLRIDANGRLVEDNHRRVMDKCLC